MVAGRLMLALFAITSPAFAQDQCGPTVAAIETLSTRFGEGYRSGGLADGILVQMFANPQTGTWTVLATDPRGFSCVIAAGGDYQEPHQGGGEGL